MVRVYAVASAKGGVGKTTTAAALGAVLAAGGRRTAVVDADVGMANLGGTLGADADAATVHDVLAGLATPGEATYEGPAGLSVLPGDTDLAAFPDADPARLGELIDALADHDFVLVDTGAGLSHDAALPLGLADGVLLVSTPDRTALRDTAKTRDVAERLGGRIAGVALTRVDPEGFDAVAVGEHLDVPLLASIPEDPSVAAAADASEPLPSYAPDSPAAEAYRTLASELVGEAVPATVLTDAGETPRSDGGDGPSVAAPSDDDSAPGEPPSDGSPSAGTAETAPVEEAGSPTDGASRRSAVGDDGGGGPNDRDDAGDGAGDVDDSDAGAADGADDAGVGGDHEADANGEDDANDGRRKGFLGRLFG
ncbi:nucleotide-binding protein [Halegenticoccus tardaugens]|uniref:nucleotide-binding protein n=1 Tax=Halegenticoccus tardaugens TaxID=2071624 RepID=UPI00100B5346|nr:P-loop NTPase [Halegenticoccus tardaugens]